MPFVIVPQIGPQHPPVNLFEQNAALLPYQITVSVAVTDSGSVTDSAGIALSPLDAGTGSDTAAISFATSDSSTGTDSSGIGIAQSDSGAGTDSVGTGVGTSDISSGSDLGSLVVAEPTLDSITATESISIELSIYVVDSFVLGEVPAVTATPAGFENIFFNEFSNTQINANASESVALSEAASIVISIPTGYASHIPVLDAFGPVPVVSRGR